jgi:hypothetical protein
MSGIEKWAFEGTALIEIIIPSLVELLAKICFSEWRSLSSVTFESSSRLSRFERNAFDGTGLIEIKVEIVNALRIC